VHGHGKHRAKPTTTPNLHSGYNERHWAFETLVMLAMDLPVDQKLGSRGGGEVSSVRDIGWNWTAVGMVIL
jgi:hypothetical protein